LSPTPVTFTLPTEPVGYAWEATSEAVAARFGLPVESIARFDLNTVPTPPELAERLLREGQFGLPISEYPPSDYRELVEAAAGRYGCEPEELLVGAGADEVLDLLAKAFIPPGGAAILPTPTYAMFSVLTAQRPGRVIEVPRGASDGFALDVEAIVAAAAEPTTDVRVVWLANPNNPTALPEADGVIESLLSRLAAAAASADRQPPIVVLDEAYAEFVGTSLAGLRHDHPNLVVVRTMSKAYALAGLRVGFAIARPETIARIAPYRPPGSVSVVSVAVATRVIADDSIAADAVETIVAERERLARELRAAGWRVLPSRTNFLLVDFETATRSAGVAEGLLRRGLVPRTFPADHPLAAYLRITVRNRAQDDRLIQAARELR
jgi:histidinol-phosphate aminotransferase